MADIESKSHPPDAPPDGAARSIETGVSIRIRYGETRRGLPPGHVQLMAITGSIGTALFVGIGGRLSQSGPLSLLLAFTLWGTLFI
ncbi:proline permease [Metarhizium album ARSEF 1941]|uniref:Proline permease n=1 Tax=Metarhizium album (strain ARSEF 1941) TaxID=1081103 RepID=A0A0B2WX03_METAS|nr:proline permease [Metarhizium album ARSEF 1941]KHN97962.1 proline permease [Metarhizium album ARSEF 1941]